MLEVLRDNVSYETGEVARAITFVEERLELLSPSLVDELQVVVLLVDELPLEFIHAFLLG